MKQPITTSKLYRKFYSSLINACSSLFVWFSFVFVQPKQRKTEMAEMNLGEVLLSEVLLAVSGAQNEK